MHLIVLHDSAGSGNPLGVSGNSDRLPFAPYFIFKDLITIFIFILVLSIFVFFMPNVLGDSENYVMANPMQTPPAIVPEWYLLPFYAILRSIPNKLLGVIAMFSAILILLIMPFTDLSRYRGIQFRPLSKIAFFIFVGNFLILMQLGAEHVESPFIEFGQISTALYFAHFLIIIPLITLLENSLIELASKKYDTDTESNMSLHTIISKSAFPLYDYLMKIFSNCGSKKDYHNKNIEDCITYSNQNYHNNWFCKNCKDNNHNIELGISFFKHIINLRNNSDGTKTKAWKEWIVYEIMWIIAFSVVIYFFILMFYKNTTIDTCLSMFYSPEITYELCDAPRPWGVYFQDSATPQMEGLVELHDNILFYLVIILFGVGWILVSVIKSYKNAEAPISHKYLSHGTLIELIWTITPALILILIAFPSFKLLYLMDEVSDPSMAVLVEGHQWYWSYQYPDFLNNDDEFIEFDSYLVPESDLQDGALRMLEVDNRLIIPELTHVRFIVTGADVIHSFACPALGIKCDAYPGRLNQVSVMINREGTFYGQCSEICGILHSSMPIVIESVSIEKFVSWLLEQ